MGPGFESQPVHKAPREIGGLFCFKDVSKARFRKRTRSKKGNETQSGSFTPPPNNRGKFWVRTPFRDVGEVQRSRQSLFIYMKWGEDVRAKRERQSHFDLNMLKVGVVKRSRQSLAYFNTSTTPSLNNFAHNAYPGSIKCIPSPEQ